MSLKYTKSKYQQQGIGLPAAIFIITVLALIVLALANLESETGEALGQDVQSARAMLAADSGVEVALGVAFGPGAPKPAECDLCTAPKPHGIVNSLDFDTLGGGAPSGLAECSYEVRCCQRSDALGDRYFKFTSTGRCGNGLDQARRIVEVAAKEVVP